MILQRDPGPWQHSPEHSNTIRAEVHTALDEILDAMAAQDKAGGESIISSADSSALRFRLTFCDFSGQAICPFCGGTGLAQHPTRSN